MLVICDVLIVSRQMIKSLADPKCSEGDPEECNYLCDTFVAEGKSLPDMCNSVKFKGPGYVNYSKVYSHRSDMIVQFRIWLRLVNQ